MVVDPLNMKTPVKKKKIETWLKQSNIPPFKMPSEKKYREQDCQR